MPTPLRLLLIEDSEIGAEILRARLQSGGYAVACEQVETEAAMRAALERQPWDLIISDHVMPQFSAPAALKVLKEFGADIPFIIVSGEISQQLAVEAMRAGAKDYVYKDDLARLLPAVEREMQEARRRHEQHSAEAQVRFQARLLDMVEQAVIATDAAGKIIYWNRHAESLFGREALGGATGKSPTPGTEWAGLGARLGRATRWSGEAELPSPDGSVFPALVTTSPIYDASGQPAGAVHVIADMTERQKAEEALRRQNAEVEILRQVDRLRADLLANVSHELRSPLGLILVFCTTLLSPEAKLDPAVQQEFLHNIEDEARRLQHIVDELLDSARIQRGRLLLEQRALDLADLLPGLLRKLRPQLGEHPVRLELSSTPPTALGDSRAVEQVLRNLLTNAAKFSASDSPIVVGAEAAGDMVQFSVQDQGYGISAEALPHVFERFFRADDEQTRQAPGIGLGLSICRELVEAQGGKIWAESTPGQGSTFRFVLPRGGTPPEAHADTKDDG